MSLATSRSHCQNIHLPLLCYMLQNNFMCFIDLSFHLLPKAQNSSSLGHCVVASEWWCWRRNMLLLTRKCSHRVKEYERGGHKQCHKISNSLNKQCLCEVDGIKLWGWWCSLWVTFEASCCPLGFLSHLHIIQFCCATLGHSMLEITVCSFLWCEKH